MTNNILQIINIQDITNRISFNFGKYFEFAYDESIGKITAVNNKGLFCRFDIIKKEDEKICILYKLLDYHTYDIINESFKLFEISNENLNDLLYDFISLSLQKIIFKV